MQEVTNMTRTFIIEYKLRGQARFAKYEARTCLDAIRQLQAYLGKDSANFHVVKVNMK